MDDRRGTRASAPPLDGLAPRLDAAADASGPRHGVVVGTVRPVLRGWGVVIVAARPGGSRCSGPVRCRSCPPRPRASSTPPPRKTRRTAAPFPRRGWFALAPWRPAQATLSPSPKGTPTSGRSTRCARRDAAVLYAFHGHRAAGAAEVLLLEAVPTCCRERRPLTAHGRPRTDATPSLGRRPCPPSRGGGAGALVRASVPTARAPPRCWPPPTPPMAGGAPGPPVVARHPRSAGQAGRSSSGAGRSAPNTVAGSMR